MTRIKDLFGAAEAAPFQNESYIEFFRSLLEPKGLLFHVYRTADFVALEEFRNATA
jgi:hypothetical protein